MVRKSLASQTPWLMHVTYLLWKQRWGGSWFDASLGKKVHETLSQPVKCWVSAVAHLLFQLLVKYKCETHGLGQLQEKPETLSERITKKVKWTKGVTPVGRLHV
jgi:hypothetical protein